MTDMKQNLIQDVLQMKTINSKRSKSTLWGTVNFAVCTSLAADMYTSKLTCLNPILWWISFVLSIICLLNTLYYVKTYLQCYFSAEAVPINSKQKSLFSISNSDVGFNVTATSKDVPASPTKALSFSEVLQSTMPKCMGSPLSTDTSQHSPYRFSTSPPPIFPGASTLWDRSGNESANLLAQNTSRGFQQDESWHLSGLSSPHSPFSPPRNLSFIHQDPLSSSGLMQDFSPGNANSMLQEVPPEDVPNSFGGSFWSYSTQGGLHLDHLASLKKNVYQPAKKDSDLSLNTSTNKTDSVVAFSATSASQIWQKRGVTPQQLFKFEENMRIWISMNILQPLVELIDQCNQSLAYAAPDIQIGSVGIEKIKKALQNISTVKHLGKILPFLEITVHQDYLVRRLQDLAKGGAMSNFRWNSGGKCDGQEWRDEFPTDSYIIIHLFAMFMDNHLPPDPTIPDGRVFSNLHLIKTPEKPPKNPLNPSLYMVHINPPDFKVVLPQEGECEVGSGHKNCLHALILFCHYIVHQEHSHLAGIFLELSGINLAWVVNSKETQI